MPQIKLTQILNESSTLRRLGATSDQLKKAHTYGEVRIKHDAKYEEIKSKGDLRKALEDYNGHSYPVLVGMRRDEKLYVAIHYNRGYSLRLIDKDGKVEESESNLDAKAIPRKMKGVKNYYISYHGRTGVISQKDNKKFELIRMFEIVVPIIEKYLSDVIYSRYSTMKKELRNAVDNDEFETVSKISSYIKKFEKSGISKKMKLDEIEDILRKLGLMNSRLMSRTNASFRENIEYKFRDWITDYWDMEKAPSEADVRTKAYKMAIDYKEKIKTEMDYFF